MVRRSWSPGSTARSDLAYCNAGHNPPFLISGGTVRRLEAGGTVMGLFDRGVYETGYERVQPGDMVVLYSDGVTEAENSAGEEVGDDRLIGWLQQASAKTATDVVSAIQRDLSAFCASAAARDDVTVMVVKVL
jgi:sigma-B regulation protein RsbU (phosphoserine phosphatase)